MINSDSLKNMLAQGAIKLGVNLDGKAIDKLIIYKDFLKEYNKKVNLTSIIDDEGIVVKHFLDSLSLVPHITAASPKIIDIGSGAGFPGMVLKIARDDIDLTLVDSTNKKIRFLQELAEMLSLDNVNCIHARAEELYKQTPSLANAFDYGVCRAVAALPKLVGYVLPYVKPGGEFIAMKGRNYHEELAEAKESIKKLSARLVDINKVTLPDGNGIDIIHNLIKIKRN